MACTESDELSVATATATLASADPSASVAEGEIRTFRLGLTPFPYAGTPESFQEAFVFIAEHADLIAHHFDDGVPWDEALAGEAYAESFQSELDARARLSPRGALRYLAITPIAFSRDGLAPHRGAAGNEPLAAPWTGRSFDSPEVIAAFLAHAERLIAQLEPDYLAYAVEANMLLDLAPESWPAFVTFAGEVHAALKAAHPDLPVFLTLQADWFHRDPARHAAALEAVLPFTDLIALSSYAYTEASDPRANDEYFAAVAALAPEKAVVIAETGWPAEDVADPYPVRIPADESAQRAYLQWLLLRA